MKMRALILTLLVGMTLAQPALAAITVTHKVVNQSTGAHTLTSSSFTPAAGGVVVVTGSTRMAASGDAIIFGNSTGETITGEQCIFNAGGDRYSFIFWYKTAGGAQTVNIQDTVTGATVFFGATLNVADLAGVDQTTVEDVAMRACNNNGGVASGTPTVTSGTSTANGVAVSVWADGNATGISFTEAATWASEFGTGNGSVVSLYSYMSYTSGATVTRSPTSASRNHSMHVFGFIEASAGGSTATNRSLLGVGK